MSTHIYSRDTSQARWPRVCYRNLDNHAGTSPDYLEAVTVVPAAISYALLVSRA
ncbi:hypothetical protein [Alicyclobacillus suci]|uniref:hypothetical protein n=1 Tax=Alicyclobacillus suci TaxID=2816080 RepID=UPI001A8C561B|nr:hypothetical protein [Alicyclobacillus suci]